MEQQRLILAVILTTIILVGWQYLFSPAKKPIIHNESQVESVTPSAPSAPEAVEASRDEFISEGYENRQRVRIDNQFVHGSINLKGARLDDLTFAKYKENLDDESSEVILFSPSATQRSYFAEFGWVQGNGDEKIELPNSETLWNIERKSNDNQVVIYWENSEKIKFVISFNLDDHYMFDIKQTVQNNSDRQVKLYPYSILNRAKENSGSSNMIIHEGAIGVFNDKLEEISFSDIESDKKIDYKRQKGWVGFSDKYWLTAFIPSDNQSFDSNVSFIQSYKKPKFQVDLLKEQIKVNVGQSASDTTKLFAGAKKLDLLDEYQKSYNITLFDRAVDFGVLYFITKPIFILLNYFYDLIGNFGLAILLLTVAIKILLFPLAYKGFISMNKLKVLQPKMAALKEKHEGDSMGFQKSLMELYKKEKVNPMSGCLPILLQMPVFFALYKVLYVTIEMRHAEFFWWIKDLSAPDPTNIFTLFGLLSWNVPAFLSIGVLPMVMSFTMYVQQSLNPAPSDPIQAKVMKWLPVMFLFMFSSFPSGLVIYWAWSNTLSIIQQLFIKKIAK